MPVATPARLALAVRLDELPDATTPAEADAIDLAAAALDHCQRLERALDQIALTITPEILASVMYDDDALAEIVRILEATAPAMMVAETPEADAEALDALAEWFRENTDETDSQWGSAADFIELAADLIKNTGRSIDPPPPPHQEWTHRTPGGWSVTVHTNTDTGEGPRARLVAVDRVRGASVTMPLGRDDLDALAAIISKARTAIG